MTKATYMRKRRELLAQLAELDAQPIDKPIDKPKQTTRRHIPTWCRPWWERRDGRQHIVYCTAARRKYNENPVAGYWIWLNGEPKVMATTMDKAKALACIRGLVYETYVWDAEQWDEYKKAHPEIGQKLAELAKKED